MAKGPRVLVVEDEVNERLGLAELLQAWGYETEVAADGADGLGKLTAFNPDVILSDLRMPVMTGMDLLRQIKESRSNIGFIILTGQGTVEEAVEAVKLGAFNFL